MRKQCAKMAHKNALRKQRDCLSVPSVTMRAFVLLLAFAASACAADLINENFASAELPSTWTPGGRKGAWSVVDGTLQGACAVTDDHGPSISVPLATKNTTLSFRVKREPGAYALMLIDGESTFGGKAHLLRVSLNGQTLNIAQDRGSPKSHVDQGKAKAEAKKANQPPPPKPTALQLADPWFYRTESLATAKLTTKPEDWLKIEVITHGNNVTVTIDDKQMVTAKSTVLDVAKSKLVFLVGGGKKMWIDDVVASTTK